MRLEVFGPRISVRPFEKPEETTSQGGIVIPGTVDMSENAEGIVLEVGDGLLLQDGTKVPLPVSPGDRVLYRKHAGAKVKLGEETLVVMELENVLGCVRA